MKKIYIFTLFSLYFLISVSHLKAEILSNFNPQNICTSTAPNKPAFIDTDKLLKPFLISALSKNPEKYTDNRGNIRISKEELIGLAINKDDDSIAEFIENPASKYYVIKRRGGGEVDPEEFLRHPERYSTICKSFDKSNNSRTTTIKRKIDTLTATTGKNFILRGQRDALTLPKKTALAATFSHERDRIEKNTKFTNKFVLGKEFSMDKLLKSSFLSSDIKFLEDAYIIPYIRHEGTFNSKASRKDVDNLAAGVLLDYYGLSFGPLPMKGTLEFNAEYLTDSEAKSEVLSGEAIIYPFFTGPLDQFLPLDEGVALANYFNSDFLGDYFDGPHIKMRASARYRFGEVKDPGLKPTLALTKQYQRLGGKFEATLTFPGNEVLKKFKAHFNYWYFDNLEDNNGITDFEKIFAEVNYKMTDDVGFGVSYTKGRNEDSLEKVDEIKANMTVIFGNTSRHD